MVKERHQGGNITSNCQLLDVDFINFHGGRWGFFSPTKHGMRLETFLWISPQLQMIQHFFITPLIYHHGNDSNKNLWSLHLWGDFSSDPEQNHDLSLPSERKTAHKKSDVSCLSQCQLMIGIDGFHHHSGTCKEPTNNKHQTFSKNASKINKKTTTSPFPAPSTRNKQQLDTLKKTQQKKHHTFSDHTDQHLWYQGQWPTKGLHLKWSEVEGLFCKYVYFFLVKNHMDTKCMWISL